jgi:hypothetical protein
MERKESELRAEGEKEVRRDNNNQGELFFTVYTVCTPKLLFFSFALLA